MKTRLIRTGNTKYVRIPKSLLDRSNHMEEVEVVTNENRIVNQSVNQPRQDWESTFRAMAECDDDDLLDKDMLVETQWDETEWQW